MGSLTITFRRDGKTTFTISFTNLLWKKSAAVTIEKGKKCRPNEPCPII